MITTKVNRHVNFAGSEDKFLPEHRRSVMASAKKSKMTCLLVLFCLALQIENTCAQSPGGVSSNLWLWTKADLGVSTSGSNVTQWTNQAATPMTAQASQAASSDITLNTNYFNYNPAIVFTGTSGKMLTGTFASAPANPALFFVVSQNTASAARCCSNTYALSPAGAMGANFDPSTGFYGVDGSGIFCSGTPNQLNQKVLVRTDYDQVTSSNSARTYLNSLGMTVCGGGGVITPDGIFQIGGRTYGGLPTRIFPGVIAEVIHYNTNTGTSATDIQKIESYLALKYGITLDQTSPTSYLASDGTNMWNAASAATGFNKNIFGIGRDDASALSQKVSGSVNAGSILTLATTNNFVLANQDVSRTALSADLSFEVVADNGGAASWSSTGVPAGYNILSRQWQVQEAGTVGSVNVQFDVGNATFDVPALLTGTSYYLVTDPNADGNYTDGVVIALTNTSGNLWAGTIDFTTGTKFTLATKITGSPGGVSAGLRAWYKADADVYSDNGITSASDGNAMQQWNDQTSSALHLSQATAALKPVFKNGSLGLCNYNPYAVFTDNNLQRAAPGLFVASTSYPQFNYYLPYIDDSNTDFDWVIYQGTSGTDRFSISMNFGGATNGDIDLPTTNRVSYNHTSIFGANKLHLSSYKANTNGVHNTGAAPQEALYIDGTQQASKSTYSPYVATNTTFQMGDNDIAADAANNPFTGKIPEFILYTGALSQAEHERIESYLAIKYSTSLSHNYFATTGTTVFALTTTYTNNIIGIARDDAGSLNQKQSKTNDDSLRVYIGTLAANNASNAGAISTNTAYIVIGASPGRLCAGSNNNERPASCSLYGRIEREWKISNTNFSNSFALDIKLNACATASLNVADLRVLIDDDGNFAAGTTNCYFNGDGTGISISYAAPIITISGISNTHIPQNSSLYLTIASSSSLTPLPVGLLDFTATYNKTGRQVDLAWQTASEVNNDYFTIERSLDAQNWEFVLQRNGAGNSNTQLNYQDADTSPYSGLSYYRLKQTNFDNTYTYAGIRDVQVGDDGDNLFILQPNPANTSISLQWSASMTGMFGAAAGRIFIYNSFGQVVQCESIMAKETRIKQINIESLAEGMYWIKVEGMSGTQLKSFVIAR